MALILANRVQESATANTTVSFTLTGAVTGFQSFAAIGNGNTTFYSATDTTGQWEVGLGTYSTTGPTLTRTTVYASSNTGSAVTFSGVVTVFVTYPSGRSVNLNESGNVSALGTVSSGTWQGSTVAVAYGGTGVTSSSGANSVVLRDSNQNIAVNRVNQANTTTTAAGGTTNLTAASSYIHTLVGTGGQTYALPDATTLTTGVAFVFNNIATGNLTITDYASATIGTIASGGAGAVFLTNNGTVGGTWDLHAYLPEGVTFGTNAFNLGSAVISGGTWQGGTIQPAYGGTGLTTFVGANNALYSTGSTTLTAGTLPSAAGGTGLTTFTGANNALYSTSSSALTAGTLPIAAGGTGQTTANAAFNALVPSQTSQSGKYLTTNGTNTSWGTVSAPPSLTNDTSTASNLYPLFAAATSGTPSTIFTSNAQYLFKPSTGELSVKAPRASNGIVVNSQSVSENYTIAVGDNGMSAGPITISAGIAVTISSGSIWTVV
jgi:hypothetical protein